MRCSKCTRTFKNSQGLAAHMRWHDRQQPTEERQAITWQGSKSPGHFQSQMLEILSRHPDGISCKAIAEQMQKGGYNPNSKREIIAQRVSSSASKMNEVVRVGRGIYRLRKPSVQPESTVNKSGLTAPKLPVEALFIQIEHLTQENNRLRRAATILMSGD